MKTLEVSAAMIHGSAKVSGPREREMTNKEREYHLVAGELIQLRKRAYWLVREGDELRSKLAESEAEVKRLTEGMRGLRQEMDKGPREPAVRRPPGYFWAEKIDALLDAGPGEHVLPGDPIVKTNCPSCGVSLRIEHGDEPGDVVAISKPAAGPGG